MNTVQYKCPNCGGELQFNAAKQAFSCEFCMSDFTEEDIKKIFKSTEEMDLSENFKEPDKEEAEFADHTNLYLCGSCGAEIIAEETTSATFCYYCHNPVILKGRLSGDFKPSKVIPFKLTRDDSIAKFKDWCGKKWFVPSEFKSEQQLEKLSGVYVPFWIANCKADAKLSGTGNQTKSWHSGDYKYTETKKYAVERAVDVSIDGIPADGASKIPDDLMEAIEPFDYKQTVPFSMSYLSGFLADKYDVDKQAVFPRVKQRAEEACNNILNDSVTQYTSVTEKKANISILKTDWEYMLLPVWFMSYKYNDEIYSFAVNAQTGKTSGSPPLSQGKLLAFCGVLTLASMIIGILGGLFLS